MLYKNDWVTAFDEQMCALSFYCYDFYIDLLSQIINLSIFLCLFLICLFFYVCF